MTSPLINYFFTILNMSYTACFVVGAVLLARLLLNWLHAPKIFSYALWAVVLFRLLCPISFESALSPLPSAEVISPQVVEQRVPQIHSGIALIDEPLNAHWQNSYYEGVTQPASQMQHWAGLAAGVWLAGAALLLHWFNPLVWLAFRLGVQDMEMACDEAVLRRLSPKDGPDIPPPCCTWPTPANRKR